MNTYCISYKIKRALVFAISMRELEYQAEKKARWETDLRTVILAEYYYVLDIF